MRHIIFSPRQLLIYALVAMVVVSLITAHTSFAAGNILYVTPTSSQVNISSSITVNVRGYVETSPSNGSVSGTFTYPKNLLRVSDVSTSGSAYNNPTLNRNDSNGTIGFSGTKSPGPTGQVQIFSVTFQAIAAGTATAGFAAGSTINQAGTTLNSGSYTIINPNPTPNPTPTPTPNPTPKPTPTPTPTPVTPSPTDTTATPAQTAETPAAEVTEEDTTGLIDNVSVQTGYTSSTITWKLNATSGSTEFAYGASSDTITTKVAPTKGEAGTYTATLSSLVPGNRYYFSISGLSDAKKPGNYSGIIIAKGYPVKLVVTEGGVPSTSAKIRIGQQSYAVSEKDGALPLSLAKGIYNAVITTDTLTKDVAFTVAEKTIPKDGKAPDLQAFNFELPAAAQATVPGTSVSIFAFIGAMLAGLALMTVGGVAFVAIRRRRMETGLSSAGSTTSVIIEDGYDWQSQPPVMPPQPYSPPGMPDPGTMSNEPYDDEPKDMFELAREHQVAPTSHPDDWPQNSNQPRSTTL